MTVNLGSQFDWILDQSNPPSGRTMRIFPRRMDSGERYAPRVGSTLHGNPHIKKLKENSTAFACPLLLLAGKCIHSAGATAVVILC